MIKRTRKRQINKQKAIIVLIVFCFAMIPIYCFAETVNPGIDISLESQILEWAGILIPSIVAIVGFIITNRNTKKGFVNTIKQKNNDQKREVYTAAFTDIDELVTKNNTLFNTEHFEKIVSHKAKIKLCGSNSVIKCYEAIFTLYLDTIAPYWEWVADNHPKNKFEDDYIEDHYKEYEDEIDLFNEKCRQYMRDNLPDKNAVQQIVGKLLSEMRKDIGTDETSC